MLLAVSAIVRSRSARRRPRSLFRSWSRARSRRPGAFRFVSSGWDTGKHDEGPGCVPGVQEPVRRAPHREPLDVAH